MAYHRLTQIEVLSDFRLHLHFSNGENGIFDARKHLVFDGVFEPLNRPEFFAQAQIEPLCKTLTWPGELDLCPDCVYHWATGTPFPDYVWEYERKQEKPNFKERKLCSN